jgi:N-acyl-D-aspartate/D-glutamate deacylase
MFPFGTTPDYAPAREKSLEAQAARAGQKPEDFTYDYISEGDGTNFIFAPLTNFADYTLDATAECLRHRNAIIGLSDGGAHVGFISDGSFPTFVLQYWSRHGFPMEELVRRQTSDTARAMGLSDRGVLAPGLLADLNIIAPDELRLEAPSMLHDLPAGGKRLMQRARGYRATIKRGVVTYRDGKATGALPGKLLRRGRA